MKDNVQEAKESIKAHIKLFEAMLKHLNGNDEQLKARSMWTSWCFHRYINDHLINDIQQAMKEHADDEAKD